MWSDQIELTSPAASEQSRADCEAICKLGLKAKVRDITPRVTNLFFLKLSRFSHISGVIWTMPELLCKLV